MPSVSTKFKILTRLPRLVSGIVLLDKDQNPIAGGPIDKGWFPAKGDKLVVTYDPKE